MIDASTRLCGLIGNPVRHTVSPQMHNAAFRALKLNYVYLAFEVEAHRLGEAVKGLRSLGARGFNVTIPYKVEVMRFLDRLDPTAEKTGAVNTVVIDDEMTGYNTDVVGVEAALREAGCRGNGQAMIIGAGGVARAAAYALRRLGYRDIIVANRTRERALRLAQLIEGLGGKPDVTPLEKAGEYSRRCEVIVNCTPLGMVPDTDSTPLRSKEIPGDSVVLDLVYNPLKTKLLREAERAGARTVDGLVVLVEQGAVAFKLWTGLEPPRDLMRREAERGLGASD